MNGRLHTVVYTLLLPLRFLKSLVKAILLVPGGADSPKLHRSEWSERLVFFPHVCLYVYAPEQPRPTVRSFNRCPFHHNSPEVYCLVGTREETLAGIEAGQVERKVTGKKCGAEIAELRHGTWDSPGGTILEFLRDYSEMPNLTALISKPLSHYDRMLFSTASLLASHQGEPGSIPGRATLIFACGNHAGRCRWAAGFLGISRSPSFSFRHCSILTSITLFGSQGLAVKSRLISSLILFSSLPTLQDTLQSRIGGLTSVDGELGGETFATFLWVRAEAGSGVVVAGGPGFFLTGGKAGGS
ncbi:hypothetical protein PR048_002852 [Dryococelus australis]|uniref:Uncharacterized protein n=1 Tax=Dryococelus australis TaxID=614101 RepID=A0ABQ9IMV0_9NEOP|nr:hypothetical protein PR048_002852 [Dryococelus australis]